MIDFWFIYDFIRKNFIACFAIMIFLILIALNWNNIIQKYEAEQGRREFYQDYHRNRK